MFFTLESTDHQEIHSFILSICGYFFPLGVPFISQVCETLLKVKPSLGRRVFSWELKPLVVFLKGLLGNH